MKETLDFLKRLLRNNNREWFAQHKEEYTEIQTRFRQFTEKLIAGISAFDETVSDLDFSKCTYRIYRDIRFSPNKQPYKTHIGAYVCPGGKCSGRAGYYFHVEPQESEYLNGSMLAVGIYNPTPAVLKSIREEILVNGEEFDAAVREAKNFSFMPAQYLQRVPKGFPKDHPFVEYMKLREYSMVLPLSEKELLSHHLFDFLMENFQSAKHYNSLLNRAFSIAEEE